MTNPQAWLQGVITSAAPSQSPYRRLKPQLLPWLAGVSLLSLTAGCIPDLNGDGTNPSADGTYTSPQCKSSANPIPHANEGIWTAVVLNDVVPHPADQPFTCGDGVSPYKFFVQFNQAATDLTVTLEPGGGCWDYETCKGQAGVLNTVRLGGVADDMMTHIDLNQNLNTSADKPWAAMYPHLGRIDNGVPTNKYNHVFFPYCTGDAFTGKQENEYKSGSDSFKVKHHGRRNLEAAAQWLTQTFPSGYTGQLLVAGSSAGAVGAVTNYPLIRDALNPKCGALLSDAGPIFPPKGGIYPPDMKNPLSYPASPQQGLLDKVGNSWGLKKPGGIVEQLDNRFGNNWYRLVKDYFGHVNRGLARAYPKDRFLFTTFKQDLNFSIFSFVAGGAIKPGNDIADKTLSMWQTEVTDFKKWIDGDSSQNWGYYLPNFRPDFCSHMVATTPFSMVHDAAYRDAGIQGRANGYFRTDIPPSMDLGKALRQLLDPSQKLPRYEAAVDPEQLSYTSKPGVGKASGNWYDLGSGALIEDKQAFINAERQRCVDTKGYPH